jgi:protein PhnA
MAKGYQGNKDRLDEISSFGKAISKRADFKCEWCDSQEDLRVWDYKPDALPNMETIALLCKNCRDLADGKKTDANELRSIRDALWSSIPAVAEGATKVLVQCKEAWVRDAIDQSFIDDSIKEQLLAQSTILKP